MCLPFHHNGLQQVYNYLNFIASKKYITCQKTSWHDEFVYSKKNLVKITENKNKRAWFLGEEQSSASILPSKARLL